MARRLRPDAVSLAVLTSAHAAGIEDDVREELSEVRPARGWDHSVCAQVDWPRRVRFGG